MCTVCCAYRPHHKDEKTKSQAGNYLYLVAVAVDAVAVTTVFLTVAQLKVPPVIIRLFCALFAINNNQTNEKQK